MAVKTHGTAILTCKSHPTYRWTKTKHHEGKGPREYIGAGILMFNGEEGGKPACPMNMSESSLADTPVEYQEHFREKYIPECDCPLSDLVFHAWVEETV